jgi:nicotinamide-nucleotide amidase
MSKQPARSPRATNDDRCIDQALTAKADQALRRLKRAGLTAITAESCTAGLVAAALSQAEGASDQLHGSFVTYTKEHKTMALGVPAALLQREGAVNENVARKMAQGALQRSPADIALAVTGVLGPAEDDDGNPVGLVYFASCKRGGKCTIERKQYPKMDHDQLRRRVVLRALELLRSWDK